MDQTQLNDKLLEIYKNILKKDFSDRQQIIEEWRIETEAYNNAVKRTEEEQRQKDAWDLYTVEELRGILASEYAPETYQHKAVKELERRGHYTHYVDTGEPILKSNACEGEVLRADGTWGLIKLDTPPTWMDDGGMVLEDEFRSLEYYQAIEDNDDYGCDHQFETRALFTSTYSKCKKCGREQ